MMVAQGGILGPHGRLHERMRQPLHPSMLATDRVVGAALRALVQRTLLMPTYSQKHLDRTHIITAGPPCFASRSRFCASNSPFVFWSATYSALSNFSFAFCF